MLPLQERLEALAEERRKIIDEAGGGAAGAGGPAAKKRVAVAGTDGNDMVEIEAKRLEVCSHI